MDGAAVPLIAFLKLCAEGQRAFAQMFVQEVYVFRPERKVRLCAAVLHTNRKNTVDSLDKCPVFR